MSLSDLSPGIYRGVVAGPESGHCTARIEVRAAPGGCLTLDYEAVSDAHGLQHTEHTVITPDALHVAFDEGRGVTVFTATAPGIYESAGRARMRIVAAFEDDELSWAWHWGGDDGALVEQSRARCRRAAR